MRKVGKDSLIASLQTSFNEQSQAVDSSLLKNCALSSENESEEDYLSEEESIDDQSPDYYRQDK